MTPVMLCVPLGLYMLFLANMHLNDRPSLVRATRDFWWLLAGLGGILVFGIPGAMARFYEIMHLRSLASPGPRSVFEEPAFWTLLFVLYFVVVVSLVALELWHRRPRTYIYHLNQNMVKPLLSSALQQAGVAFQFNADRECVHLALGDLPGTNLAWKLKPNMGLCILEWGTVPESVRASVEEKLQNAWWGAGYTGSMVPGAVLMGLATVLVVGSMVFSLMQLVYRFGWH